MPTQRPNGLLELIRTLIAWFFLEIVPSIAPCSGTSCEEFLEHSFSAFLGKHPDRKHGMEQLSASWAGQETTPEAALFLYLDVNI